MTSSRVAAIIPARGGSKGIPRKNLRLLAGTPLIARTIEVAQRAETVDRVVVSTDDREIASIAEEHGADMVWRPTKLGGDAASSESALLHALDSLQREEGYEPDLVVFLQCTSPLTLPEDVDGTVELMLREGADSALAVTRFHHFLWKRKEYGSATGVNHDKQVRPLRQDREDQFLETGAVYVMRAEGFKEAKHRFFGKIAMYVMPGERCWEIDELVDLSVAEVLVQRLERERRLKLLPSQVSALALDFDGVLTDNRVFVCEDGREAVACNRSDGLGLAEIKRVDIPVVVLSTEVNPVVSARCRKLGLECLQGLDDKRAALSDWLQKRNLDTENVVYVGNDINDLPCMELAACSVAVSDAHTEVLRAARMVLSNAGGHGAVREICDLILEKMRGVP